MKKNLKTAQPLKLLLINLAIVLTVIITFISLGHNDVITITAMAMNIRNGPGVDYDIAAQVKRGDKLVVLREENQWYQVRINKKTTGWVASWLVDKGNASASPATNIYAKVNTANTKLRENSNTESTELASLKKGTKVTVTSEQEGWSKVTVNKKEGWIFSDLLTINEDPDNSTNKKPLSDQLYARQDATKVRSKPGADSDIVTTINYGESLLFKASEGDWYQVETTDGQKGYVANWVVNFAELDKDNKKTATSIAEATIVLDPGHGGKDVGAQSNDETISEKVVTLATANFIEAELRKLGANVILTRSDDRFLELQDITLKSNRARADIFISIHYDSTEVSNQASGFTTYYYHDKDNGLATVVNKHLEKQLPLPNRGVETGDFQVLRDNERPALLLELGYMNNDSDAHTFKTKKFQRQVAKAIKNALVEYFEQ